MFPFRCQQLNFSLQTPASLKRGADKKIRAIFVTKTLHKYFVRAKSPMGSSIKIILARMMVALVLLVGTHCCASTSSPSRPATNSANSASPSHTQVDFYCRKDACPGGVANVGCQCGTGASYGAGCSGKAAQKIALDQRTKDLILREHNLKRNLIACGSIEPFEPAARMAEVVRSGLFFLIFRSSFDEGGESMYGVTKG